MPHLTSTANWDTTGRGPKLVRMKKTASIGPVELHFRKQLNSSGGLGQGWPECWHSNMNPFIWRTVIDGLGRDFDKILELLSVLEGT
jgi:hypothetical protein